MTTHDYLRVQWTCSMIPALGAVTAISIFMASRTSRRCPAFDALTWLDGDLPDAGGYGRVHGLTAFGHGILFFGDRLGSGASTYVGLAIGCPALAFLFEGGLLHLFEARGLGLDGCEELVIVADAELLLLDAESDATAREGIAHLQQLRWR